MMWAGSTKRHDLHRAVCCCCVRQGAAAWNNRSITPHRGEGRKSRGRGSSIVSMMFWFKFKKRLVKCYNKANSLYYERKVRQPSDPLWTENMAIGTPKGKETTGCYMYLYLHSPDYMCKPLKMQHCMFSAKISCWIWNPVLQQLVQVFQTLSC